jgi:hypothetical protein
MKNEIILYLRDELAEHEIFAFYKYIAQYGAIKGFFR